MSELFIFIVRSMLYKFKVKKEIIATQIKSYSKDIVLEGVGMTIVLSLLTIILLSNVVKVISKAKYNYDTYLYEKGTLTELQEKNQDLLEERRYVGSNEYRIIAMRDVLNYTSSSETLYDTKEYKTYFVEKQPVYLNAKEKENYLDWWYKLIDF